jgi:hypothetical protein
MASSIGIEFKGLDKLQKKFNGIPDKLISEIGGEIESGAQEFVSEAKRKAPINDGLLRQGIGFDKKADLNYVIFSNARYSAFVEFGTKSQVKIPAGLESVAAEFKGKKYGDYYDFLEKILDWVKKKGIGATYNIKTRRKNRQTKDQFAEIAQKIADSIMRKGIKAQPFFFNTWFEKRRNISKNIKTAVNKALK